MIRNHIVFYLALLAAAVGVAARHGRAIDSALGLDGVATGIPSQHIWLAAAAALVLLSLLPIWSRRRTAERPPRMRNFRKEDLATVAARVRAMAAEPTPDVPLIIDYTIFQAIEVGASDIHFDPSREGVSLRYRIQSMMTDVTVIPKALSGTIINRLKVISNLVIYKEALPQDGRIGEGNKGRRQDELERSGLARADFRIAFMPTLHGERVVIRILGKGDDHLDLAELGMDNLEQRTMARLLEQPQGMIILTGPTGSGKSTTIYACLRQIQGQSHAVRSIATLEDPIEFDLGGVNQSQVDEARQFTFEKGLRAILRQDPDVIMVGEIRDPETARIAIQAGMTGHLLITTVHAGSTAAVFSRLQEMGIAPYALNSSLTAVISQRLVRKICPGCRRERGFTEHDLADLEMATPPAGFRLFTGAGCEMCDGTGFLGRSALYEILEVTEPIRKMVAEGASIEDIHRVAREGGTRSLYQAAIEAVAVGLTSPEEVARVLSRDERRGK